MRLYPHQHCRSSCYRRSDCARSLCFHSALGAETTIAIKRVSSVALPYQHEGATALLRAQLLSRDEQKVAVRRGLDIALLPAAWPESEVNCSGTVVLVLSLGRVISSSGKIDQLLSPGTVTVLFRTQLSVLLKLAPRTIDAVNAIDCGELGCQKRSHHQVKALLHQCQDDACGLLNHVIRRVEI